MRWVYRREREGVGEEEGEGRKEDIISHVKGQRRRRGRKQQKKRRTRNPQGRRIELSNKLSTIFFLSLLLSSLGLAPSLLIRHLSVPNRHLP